MKRISRRFVAWAIDSKTEPFQKARLKLTLNYIVGMGILLAIFNFGVYGLFVSDLPDPIEPTLTATQRQAIDKAGERLERALLMVDGLMIIVVSGIGYYFAGRTLRPIEVMYRFQKKFVADAAHELRTPLAVIKTGAEVTLAGQPTQKDYQKLTMDSLQEVNYMATTVNDLLFLAHGDAQKTPAFEKVNLAKLVVKQAELMQPYAHKQAVALSQNCQTECFVRGNQVYLKRLLTNLLQNAIDYNKPSGTATLSLTKTSHKVTLKIIDTGIGMDNSTQAHIFDRFYKADPSRTIQSSGAGLGLSIVQEIATSHSGQISVQSQLGRGTVVCIIFPAYS